MNNKTPLVADMLRQSLDQGQMPFLTISSNSMTPLLQIGDQVGLEMATPAQLNTGDIITLVRETDLLTHRFWGLDAQGRLLTRGDRPFAPDAPSEANQLLGRAVVRRSHNRELWLQSGAGGWLNRHLAWLKQVELFLLPGRSLSPAAPTILAGRQRSLPVRLVRRVFFIWARLAVNVVTWLAGQNQQQEST